MALQKYTQADEAKIKDITLQIKLTTLVSDKKKDLDNEVTETQSKQIELDKTAESSASCTRSAKTWCSNGKTVSRL